MAPPAVHSLCDGVTGGYNGTSINGTASSSSALVPPEQCVAAYVNVGAGVVGCAVIMLATTIYIIYKYGGKATGETRRLQALVIAAILAWLIEGAGLLSLGRLGLVGGGLATATGASPSSVVDAVGREATRGALGVLLFVLATRNAPSWADVATAAALASPPVCAVAFQIMDALRTLPPASRNLFPRADTCKSCALWDSNSALASLLYGLGGVVAIGRLIYALRRSAGGIPESTQPAAIPFTFKDVLFFIPVLVGYCSADVFSITACSQGCTPYSNTADTERGTAMARLMAVSLELPLLLGLFALCAYTVVHGGERFDLLSFQANSQAKAVNKAWTPVTVFGTANSAQPRPTTTTTRQGPVVIANPVVDVVVGNAAAAQIRTTYQSQSQRHAETLPQTQTQLTGVVPRNPFAAALQNPFPEAATHARPSISIPMGPGDNISAWTSKH